MEPPKLQSALLQITDIFNKNAGSDQKIQKAELKKKCYSQVLSYFKHIQKNLKPETFL